MKRIIISSLTLLIGLISAAQQVIPHHWETAIYADDVWHYFVGTQEAPEGWNQPDFDASSWLSGKGGFGFGDGDDQTIISTCHSVFLRKSFTVSDTSKIASALIHADYDDGIILYLNGQEVARDNIIPKHPKYDYLATEQVECRLPKGQAPPVFTIDFSLLEQYLVEGENVLAAQVHNALYESIDLSSSIFLTFGIADNSSFYRNTPTWFDVPLNAFTSDMPLIVIDTQEKSIPGSDKINIRMKCISNDKGLRNHIGQEGNEYDGIIGIERRGHASSGFDQVPYNIELRDSLDESINVPLLGMPAENDWALIGNWGDKSMVRHSLSYEISTEMGHYAPRSRHCEVYIDGAYRGVYILTEKIKRDKNRVDIAKLNPDEVEDNDISGGFIFKQDYYSKDGSDSWVSTFRPAAASGDVHFVYYYPKAKNINIYQDSYIQKHINDFEKVLFGDDFKDAENGYRAYIDVPSFINFLIVNEVSRNLDKKSNYFHKDKDRDGIRSLIHAGPVWDFDWAWKYLSSAGWKDGSGWEYPRANTPIYPAYSGWFIRLMEDPQFVNEFHTTYFNYRKNCLSKNYLFHFMDSIAAYVDEEQERHFKLYPVLGKHAGAGVYNVGDVKTYSDEVARLKGWISARLEWMDANMPGEMIDSADFVPSPITYVNDYGSYYGEETWIENKGQASSSKLKLYPNPATDYLHIQTDHKIENIKIYSISGRMVKELKLANIQQQRLDVHALEQGLYLIHTIANNGNVERGTFMKQ